MKEIIKQIEKYEYVSFDIFDTLLYRMVGDAKGIFSLMELFDCSIDLHGFALKRIRAEKTAIKQSDKAEITLEEIYDALEGYNEQEKKIIQQLEINTEKRFCAANPEMLEVLNYCGKNEKHVICISDMYLSHDVIGDLLKKNGIIYEYLFVSSKCQARKSRGELYDVVLTALSITPAEIIHIGDNQRSDVWMPKLKRIRSIHYCLKWKRLESMTQNMVEGLALQTIKDWSYYKKTGFRLFGLLLVGLCQWIHQNIKTENCDVLHFFSRDGLIIKKAYDILYPDSYNEYLYVSRRSLTVPMLTEAKNMEDVLRLIPYIKREETPESLLHKMGIDDENLIKSIRDSFGEHITRKDLIGKYNHTMFEILKEVMYTESMQESKICMRYLKEYYRPSKKIAVVDIGWYGSMQLSVEKLLKHANVTCHLTGFYLGLLDKGKDDYRELDAKGYIYDYRKGNAYDASYVFGFNGLIESFFTANHGSTRKYQESDDGIEAVFEPQENAESTSVWEFQEGALKFVESFSVLTKGYQIHISREEAYQGLESLLTKPDKQEIEKFGEIEFYDMYTSKLINAKPLLTYIREPREMIRDFLKSDWKLGYIKKVLHVPPKQIYKLLVGIKRG